MKYLAFLLAVASLLLFAGCTNNLTVANGTLEYNYSLIAKNFVLSDETYAFDGIDGTLKLVNTTQVMFFKAGSYGWTYTYAFQSIYPGYGNRSYNSDLYARARYAPTSHVALVTVVDGKVTSAVLDGKWDMLAEKALEAPANGTGQNISEFKAVYSTGGGLTSAPRSLTITVYSNGSITRERVEGSERSFGEMTLSTSELAGFKELLENASVFSLNDTYLCNFSSEQCPTDLASSMFSFTIDGREKNVSMYFPQNMPPSLQLVQNRMEELGRKIGGGQGEFCGGIATGAFPCAKGFKCVIIQSYPDASGTCQPE